MFNLIYNLEKMGKMKNLLTEKQETERLKEYKKNKKLEKEKVKIKKKVDNTING